MLSGACKAAGIATSVVPTQRLVLQWLFVDHVEEILTFASANIAANIDNTTMAAGRLLAWRRQFGRRGLVQRLRNLHKILITPDWNNFLAAVELEQALDWLRSARVVLEQFAVVEGASALPFMNEAVALVNDLAPSGWLGVSLYRFSPLDMTIVRELRRRTGKKTVIGGAATGHLGIPGVERVRKENCADYLILGPADLVLPSLIVAEKRSIPVDLPGVCVLRNGQAFRLRSPEPIADLDALPFPDFSQTRLDSYATPVPVLPLQSARGCPWKKCEFCSHYKGYIGAYHALSPGRFAETVEYYRDKYGCRHIVLHDEDLPPRRALRLAEAIDRRRLNDTVFVSYARPVRGYNDESTLSRLYKAGFVSFSWGVESGSQRVLDAISKGTHSKIVASLLKKAAASGIRNVCWVMIGLPTETANDLASTVSFVDETLDSVDYWLISRFRLQKDSMMATNPKRWGIVPGKDEDDPFSISDDRAVFLNGPDEAAVDAADAALTSVLSHNRGPLCSRLRIAAANRARIIPFLLVSRKRCEKRGSIGYIVGNIQQIGDQKFLRIGLNECITLSRSEADILAATNGRLSPLDQKHTHLLQKLGQYGVVALV
jgi:hypothetical protein